MGADNQQNTGELCYAEAKARASANIADILAKASDKEVAQTLASLNARFGQKQELDDGDALMLRCVVAELDRRGLANGDAPAIAHLLKQDDDDMDLGPRETAPVHPGSDGQEVQVDPDDALYAWEKPMVLRSPAVSVVGSICTQNHTRADIDVLLHGPLSDELRHVIEFRLGRALPPELSNRLQVHPDILGGPFTDYLPVYDLALVPSQHPRQVVRMSADESLLEWIGPGDVAELDDVEKKTQTDDVPGKSFFTGYGFLARFKDKILPLFPAQFAKYVELFCGHGEMIWCMPRDFNGHSQEVMNDIDKDIIRLHRTCQTLSEASAKTLAGMNWRCAQETFNRLAKEGRSGSDLAFMHRELYLRRFSYTGREKLNLRTTDVGKDYDPLPRIMRCKARLQGIKLSNQDYRKAVAQYDSPETMFFIDPPYPGSDEYYQFKMPSLEDQMELFDKLKGKALIVLKGDAKELAPVTKRKNWRQFKFRWPHPWKGVFPGKYPEWQYGSIFTNYDPPGKSRTRKAWQVHLEKVSDDVLMAYPKDDKPHEAVVQLHSRGNSVHMDLRMLANGHLVGWTLMVQKPGAVSDTETPDQVRALYGGYNATDGNRYFKGIKAPVRVQAAPKEPQPTEWLRVDGLVAGEGEVGATAHEKGIIVAVASPTVQWGIQTKDFHEYFLEGDSQWRGSLYLRRIKLPREGGELEPVWLAWLGETNLPRVLASSEADMPPLGHSAMPRSLMAATPQELRFWEAKTEAEANELRDKLVAAKIFTEQNIRIVDGSFNRVVTKMYIEKAEPELGPDGKYSVIVSGASLRNTWQPCDPKWICSEDGCSGRCCRSGGGNSGPIALPSEEKALRKRGAKIVAHEVQSSKERKTGNLCAFQAEDGLCTLHNTPDKPMECIVSPLRVLENGTVVIRHRFYQLKCHKAGTPVPAYEAYFASLVKLFGRSQAQRIKAEAAKGVERIEAKMDPEAYKAMRFISKTRIANRKRLGISGGWTHANKDADPEQMLAKSAGDTMQILKTKDEQYVLGIVLEPNDGKDGSPMAPDTQGDIYSKAEVRQAAHKFMAEYRNVGLMHRALVNGRVEILESFVVPDGTGGFDIEDPYGEKQHVHEGTWLLGLRIVDEELWDKVKRNELSGLSIGGSARRVSAARG